MIWVWVVACVVVIGAIAVVIAGRDDEMAEVYDDRADVPMPAGRALVPGDLDRLRFSTGLRGYRMDEVDAFVDRVRADLLARADGDPESADRAPPAAPPDEAEASSAAELDDSQPS